MSNESSKSDQQRFEKGQYTDDELTRVHTQLAREHGEPTEGFSPIPIILLFIYSGIIFWAGVYIAKPEHNAGFSGNYFNHMTYHGAGVASTEQEAPRAIDPERLYRNNCQVCHQPGGTGGGAFPPLADSDWVHGNEQRVIRVILNGLMGPVTVNGEEYNSAMPTMGQLKDAEIAALLTFLRSNWGNDAPEITEETVAAVRKEVGSRGPWTAAELEEFQ